MHNSVWNARGRATPADKRRRPNRKPSDDAAVIPPPPLTLLSAPIYPGTFTGSEAVRQSAVQLFSMLTSLSRDIHRVLVPADDLAVVEATVSYRFVNGAEVTLPCTTTFRFRDNEVREVHPSIDSSAISAAALGGSAARADRQMTNPADPTALRRFAAGRRDVTPSVRFAPAGLS